MMGSLDGSLELDRTMIGNGAHVPSSPPISGISELVWRRR